jgi:hypothetical protein
VTAALAQGTASASVPVSLLSSTSKMVLGQMAVSGSIDFLVKGALKTMLLAKLKLAVGAVMVVVVLSASGLVYRASGQPTPIAKEQKPGGKPRSELEALRHENELLKLNLEVVLEKVRAQEAELHTFREQAKAALNDKVARVTEVADKGFHYEWRVVNQDSRTDPLHEAEASLKALRDATDQESRRRAADQLEKSLKELREKLKKQEAPPPGP